MDARALLGMVLLLPGLARAEGRRAVVVELYSSEGCSSCPDADAVLAGLDRDQPVASAEVLALELHVDYWNRLGWADPFSSAAFSDRQAGYAEAFGRDGVYTPQAVIDGAAEGIGSDGARLRQAIAAAARRPAAQVGLKQEGDKVLVEVSALPPGADAQAEVWLALTERGLHTDVPRGENAGRNLAHGPVVRRLEKLGQLEGGAFHGSAAAALPRGVNPAHARWVAFVQERKSRHLVGSAAADAH